jgi:hypothetical protein
MFLVRYRSQSADATAVKVLDELDKKEADQKRHQVAWESYGDVWLCQFFFPDFDMAKVDQSEET